MAKSIESGALNLCNASHLLKVFDTKAQEKKPLSTEMKKALVSQVENQSRRQAANHNNLTSQQIGDWTQQSGAHRENINGNWKRWFESVQHFVI